MDNKQIQSMVDRFNKLVDSASKEELLETLQLYSPELPEVNREFEGEHMEKISDNRFEELLDAALFNNNIDNYNMLNDIYCALEELRRYRKQEKGLEVAIFVRAGAVEAIYSNNPYTKASLIDYDLTSEEEIEERKRREKRVTTLGMKRLYIER